MKVKSLLLLHLSTVLYYNSSSLAVFMLLYHTFVEFTSVCVSVCVCVSPGLLCNVYLKMGMSPADIQYCSSHTVPTLHPLIKALHESPTPMACLSPLSEV